jgi:hypothetical protein
MRFQVILQMKPFLTTPHLLVLTANASDFISTPAALRIQHRNDVYARVLNSNGCFSELIN